MVPPPQSAGQSLVVFVTVPSAELARSIARHIVDQRLAACVNVVSSVESIYRWEGQRCEEAECLMIIKTRAPIFERLAREVRALHSYTVPEIIALPIVAGSPDYLQWIEESTAVSGDAV